MNKIILITLFIFHLALLGAQNEVDLISINYTSKLQPSIENDDHIQLKDVAITTITKELTLNYGHPIGKKGIQALYSLDYQHYDQKLDLSLIEMSPDLLESDYFDIPNRPEDFIPKPFIYTDSIITKQNIRF